MRPYILLLITFLLISCDLNDDGSSDPCQGIYCDLEDVSGDAAFAFIDIGKVGARFTDTEIIIEINILDIPASLTYNSVNLPDNYLEYSWKIDFDVDNDGTSANDIRLAMSHFKFPGSIQSTGDILDFTQKNVWLADDVGTAYSLKGSISVTKDNSKLTFSVLRSEHPKLQNVDKTTPVKFEAFYKSSSESYRDIYPDDGSYFK